MPITEFWWNLFFWIGSSVGRGSGSGSSMGVGFVAALGTGAGAGVRIVGKSCAGTISSPGTSTG